MDIETARAAYRTLCALYAALADRGSGEEFAALFTDDGIIVSPRGRLGKAEITGVPAYLRRTYATTRHEVMNQTLLQSDNGSFTGETYGMANHLAQPGYGLGALVIWKIRYQDELRAAGDELLLVRRELVIDWTETRDVNPPGTLYHAASRP